MNIPGMKSFQPLISERKLFPVVQTVTDRTSYDNSTPTNRVWHDLAMNESLKKSDGGNSFCCRLLSDTFDSVMNGRKGITMHGMQPVVAVNQRVLDLMSFISQMVR